MRRVGVPRRVVDKLMLLRPVIYAAAGRKTIRFARGRWGLNPNLHLNHNLSGPRVRVRARIRLRTKRASFEIALPFPSAIIPCMTEWNIQSRAHACEVCARPFVDQQPYHTLLFDEKQEFRRQDVCPDCWQTKFSADDRAQRGFISYWQGVYEAPPPVTEAIQKETAETLLRKLIAQNDPRYAPAGT